MVKGLRLSTSSFFSVTSVALQAGRNVQRMCSSLLRESRMTLGNMLPFTFPSRSGRVLSLGMVQHTYDLLSVVCVSLFAGFLISWTSPSGKMQQGKLAKINVTVAPVRLKCLRNVDILMVLPKLNIGKVIGSGKKNQQHTIATNLFICFAKFFFHKYWDLLIIQDILLWLDKTERSTSLFKPFLLCLHGDVSTEATSSLFWTAHPSPEAKGTFGIIAVISWKSCSKCSESLPVQSRLVYSLNTKHTHPSGGWPIPSAAGAAARKQSAPSSGPQPLQTSFLWKSVRCTLHHLHPLEP